MTTPVVAMQLLPANNVLFAFAGGFITEIVLHYAEKYGYVPNPDIAQALPGGISLALAHLWDVVSGDNKKEP